MRVFVLVALWIAHASAASAYEVDNFTGRDQLTRDSTASVDRKVNEILDKAAREANRDSPAHCNRVILRREILRWVRPDPVSFLELWATFSDDVQQVRIGSDQSIYSGASLTEAPAIWLAGIGRSLRVNGHVIGTDKIGHFFMQGFDYFSQTENGATLESILRDGHGEDGIWGLPMTGVKSYADMSANFQGYRFWKQLYSGKNPYFRCAEGKGWVRQREFAWSEYVNDSWDEAINCSEMKPSLEQKVRLNLSRAGLQACPVDLRRCIEIAGTDHAELLVSPRCRTLAASERPLASQRSALSTSPLRQPALREEPTSVVRRDR